MNKTHNTYKITFADGTVFESQGSSSGYTKSTVANEFKWVATHIEQEVKMIGKQLEDIASIEYSLKYSNIEN